MKTFIFFLALFGTFHTSLCTISRYMEALVNKKTTELTREYFLGFIVIITWTIFYHL